MGKVLIAHNDLGLSASYSGGVWQDSLTPATQLSNRLILARARTMGVSNLELDITLAEGDDLAYDTFSLVNYNLTSSATARVRVYADAARTILLFDSGTRAVSAVSALAVTPVFSILSSFTLGSPYIRLNITDPTNPDGYFEFGRICIQSSWYPEFNVAYGVSWGWEDLSEIFESTTGIEFYDKRVKRRTVTLPYEILSDQEFAKIDEVIGREGLTGEVLFCFDDSSLGSDYSRTFLARMNKIKDIRMVEFNLNTLSLSLQEVL